MKKASALRMLQDTLDDFYSDMELHALCEEQIFTKAKLMDVSLLREALQAMDDRPDDEVAPHKSFVWRKIQRRIQAPVRGWPIKRIAVIVLVIMLILASVTALAVVLLSMRTIVEDHAIPVAQRTEDAHYTWQETNQLIQLANENGIVFSPETQAFINELHTEGSGYFKDEFIYDLARTEFGSDMRTWTDGQRRWLSSSLQATGSADSSTQVIIPDADPQRLEAEDAAMRHIWRRYSSEAPLDDQNRYTVFTQCWYGHPGNYQEGIYWVVTFFPKDEEGDTQYIVYLKDDMTVFSVINNAVSVMPQEQGK